MPKRLTFTPSSFTDTSSLFVFFPLSLSDSVRLGPYSYSLSQHTSLVLTTSVAHTNVTQDASKSTTAQNQRLSGASAPSELFLATTTAAGTAVAAAPLSAIRGSTKRAPKLATAAVPPALPTPSPRPQSSPDVKPKPAGRLKASWCVREGREIFVADRAMRSLVRRDCCARVDRRPQKSSGVHVKIRNDTSARVGGGYCNRHHKPLVGSAGAMRHDTRKMRRLFRPSFFAAGAQAAPDQTSARCRASRRPVRLHVATRAPQP